MSGLFDPHLMIFEPRLEGHHLTWLKYITEDFLNAGFKLTLAVDLRDEAKRRIFKHLSAYIDHVKMVSVFNQSGKLRHGDKLKAMVDCYMESGAREVFLTSMDEIASSCLRRAALGMFPHTLLQERINGIYFRPRFLENPKWPPGNAVKAKGFRRLCQDRWFKKIFLMDEYLHAQIKDRFFMPTFHFLPDPWSGDFSMDQKTARSTLDIPDNKIVLLHYGIGDKRKGLHLAVRALENEPPDSPFFLLCAGQLAKDQKNANGLRQLDRRGVAKILNRYITDEEEKICFCASDIVLLPYIDHYGSSGILSSATAAGKMVIASDYGLLARRIHEHHLGWLFPQGNVRELRKKIEAVLAFSPEDFSQFQKSAKKYAKTCSREAFTNALLKPFDIPTNRNL